MSEQQTQPVLQQAPVKKRKPIYKRVWFWIVAVIVFFIIVGNLGKSNNPTSAGENTAAPAAAKTQEKTEFAVGEIVQLKENKLTVLSVEKSNGDQFDKPKDGKEYVIVKVQIENAGKDNISYNPFDFKMSNSQGQIQDMAFTIVNSDTKLESGQLAPSGKVSGTIAYEQPKGDPKLQLQYKPSFWSNKTILVNLQ